MISPELNQSSLEVQTMKLSFRGIHYEAKPSVMECTEGQVGGKYRGTPWKVHCPTKGINHNSQHKLTYRGVTYLH